MYKRWQKNMPMYLVLLYLFFTIFLFVITYNDSNVVNMEITVIYCSIYFLSLGIGYLPQWKRRTVIRNFDYSKKIRLLVLFCAIMTMIISVYNVVAFYTDIDEILYYIVRPGEAYEYVKWIRRHGVKETPSTVESIIGITLTFLSFTKYYVSVMLVMYWKKFKKRDKIIVIISLLSYVIQTFLIGAMINIGTFFIGVFPVLLAWALIYNRHRKTAIAVSGLVMIIGALVLFYFLGSRGVFSVDNDTDTNVILSGILGFGFYISHGYQGLAYCFDIPQKFSFGYTMFYGLTSKVLPFFGLDNLFENSFLYQNQVQNGWSSTQIWSTIFPWLASDVSFVLIPMIMFAIGYIMKSIWNESISNKNPFGFVLMGQFMLLCLMIPANNQLFLTFGNSVGFLVICLFYLLSIRRVKWI